VNKRKTVDYIMTFSFRIDNYLVFVVQYFMNNRKLYAYQDDFVMQEKQISY